MIPAAVQAKAAELAAKDSLPGYVYDLRGLKEHVQAVAAALESAGVEFFYAAKANPDPHLLTTIAPHATGIEVASGGELQHVRAALPQARVAFGGPGKTDAELRLALKLGVERLHVESPRELARLIRISNGNPVDIMLRANLNIVAAGAVLSMSGPFGMDEPDLVEAAAMARDAPGIKIRGIHAHLASGLDADSKLALDQNVLSWALPWLKSHTPDIDRPEVNLGGGMAVDYTDPGNRFDWTAYAKGLAELAGAHDAQLRIEPGRAISVYDGYYVTDVLDVKWTRGQAYAITRGGTHHIRTPATKGHSQPVTVIPSQGSGGLRLTSENAAFVGQLCTPKDMLSYGVSVTDLGVGDLAVFEMAGAYAWNISHHDFLMHPHPSFVYIE